MKTESLLWASGVRDYEIDFQGIVNNAVYLNYLQEARAVYLAKMGLDVVELAQNGINIVLFETHLKYKKSLRYGDSFAVKTEMFMASRLKLFIPQIIMNTKTNEICVEAKNYFCCVDAKTNKPIVYPAFEKIPAVPLTN